MSDNKINQKTTAVFTSAKLNTNWIPVAAVGQKTTLHSGDKISLSRESLSGNLESWAGGSINVNHESNGELSEFKIEAAKFENDLLYFKVNQDVSDFIRHSASSGRSIEIGNMKMVDDVVMSYTGIGLAVLFPPHQPACGPDMGCSSTDSPIKTVFTQLSNKLKLHSSTDMNETSGTDPNLEKTMTEDTDKLKFAKMEADKSRDEALAELKTLKFSLVEKETALTDKDKTISDKDILITEQNEKLKFYADADAAAAEKKTDEQWEVIKANMPPGMFHKAEDDAAGKKEFIADPAGFSVKMVSWKREDPTGESGAEFTSGTTSDEAADLQAMSEHNRKLGLV